MDEGGEITHTAQLMVTFPIISSDFQVYEYFASWWKLKGTKNDKYFFLNVEDIF